MVGDPSELFLGFLCMVWSSFIFCQVGKRALVPLRGLFSPFPAESSAQGCIPALCPDPIPLFGQFVPELELFLKSRQGQSRVEQCQGAGSGHHQGLSGSWHSHSLGSAPGSASLPKIFGNLRRAGAVPAPLSSSRAVTSTMTPGNFPAVPGDKSWNCCQGGAGSDSGRVGRVMILGG